MKLPYQAIIEHLMTVQDVTNRLAAESANVETWPAALAMGLAVHVISLASLDAYYLGLVRRYRGPFADEVGTEVTTSKMSVGEAQFLNTTKSGYVSKVRCFDSGLTFAVIMGAAFWSLPEN
ncbi:hypothetical protein BA895_11630 [Humibacillus sp. DSM 29435]|uniref:hypothetical protein n=1 Tax=Humibacillus sp. DSM 29435 TaxID=1869167 RepID=UPI0008722101|nr:hypothetical protein [Humibacillus sp. DSM 29435]OFE14251.1 hypothetical protein BA895_11630 [Humibacillus sp. DSM 29435]